MNNNLTAGETILEAMVYHNLCLGDLVKAIPEVAEDYLLGILQDRYTITPEVAVKLARLLDLSSDYILRLQH